MASLDYTKCFDSLRVNSTAALLRQLGFHNGLTTLCEQMWTNHARWCTYNAYTSETPLKPAGMGVPQGDPCGPLMTALWLSCAQRRIEALHPNFDGETSIYMMTAPSLLLLPLNWLSELTTGEHGACRRASSSLTRLKPRPVGGRRCGHFKRLGKNL